MRTAPGKAAPAPPQNDEDPDRAGAFLVSIKTQHQPVLSLVLTVVNVVLSVVPSVFTMTMIATEMPAAISNSAGLRENKCGVTIFTYVLRHTRLVNEWLRQRPLGSSCGSAKMFTKRIHVRQEKL